VGRWCVRKWERRVGAEHILVHINSKRAISFRMEGTTGNDNNGRGNVASHRE
jgi:hypothetical protein